MGLLATAYKMPDGEIAELLEKSEEEINEKDVLKTVLKADTDRVFTLKKPSFQEGYNKAKEEVLSDFEKKIKTKFDIDSDKMGEELIEEIVTASSGKKEGGKSKEITDDDVKKHAVYVSMENNFKKQLADAKKDYDDKISSKDKEYQRKETFAEVSTSALTIFRGMNPILSSDAARAANQEADFVAKFKDYDFEKVEGNTIILKDGKVLEDAHGHKVDFEKFVKSTAEQYFDFKVAEDRSSPENKDKDKDKKKDSSYTGTQPKTKDEYLNMVNDSSIPLADRIAIRDAAPEEFKV